MKYKCPYCDSNGRCHSFKNGIIHDYYSNNGLSSLTIRTIHGFWITFTNYKSSNIYCEDLTIFKNKSFLEIKQMANKLKIFS